MTSRKTAAKETKQTEARKNLNIDDRLHLCLMSKFVTPSTCKNTKSFVDTVFTFIDQNNQALVIFFFKIGNLG